MTRRGLIALTLFEVGGAILKAAMPERSVQLDPGRLEEVLAGALIEQGFVTVRNADGIIGAASKSCMLWVRSSRLDSDDSVFILQYGMNGHHMYVFMNTRTVDRPVVLILARNVIERFTSLWTGERFMLPLYSLIVADQCSELPRLPASLAVAEGN